MVKHANINKVGFDALPSAMIDHKHIYTESLIVCAWSCKYLYVQVLVQDMYAHIHVHARIDTHTAYGIYGSIKKSNFQISRIGQTVFCFVVSSALLQSLIFGLSPILFRAWITQTTFNGIDIRSLYYGETVCLLILILTLQSALFKMYIVACKFESVLKKSNLLGP